MAHAFIALIIIYAGLAALYLWMNNFNSETLEVIFPAIGAILLSLYLGGKAIWLDAPKAVPRRIPIVLLHDRSSGLLTGMAHPRTLISDVSGGIHGLRALDVYPQLSEFKTLPAWQALKKTTSHESTDEQQVIAQLLEYTILEWLAQSELAVGYQDHGTIQLLQGAVGSGSLPGNLVSYPLSGAQPDLNPFLNARRIQLLLPVGSKVVRAASASGGIDLTLITRHSRVRVRVTRRGGGVFEQALEPIGTRIRQAYSLPERSPGVWLHAYTAQLDTDQDAFSRHSNQAKKERAWLDNLRERFEADFSWDRVRQQYAMTN